MLVIHNSHCYPRVIHEIPEKLKKSLAARMGFSISDYDAVKEKEYQDNGVGYYYNADKIINIPIGILTGVGTVMLPRMTSLNKAGKLEDGDLLIQKAPACTIQTQAEAVCELFGGKKEDIKVIGIRHGEKMYETLLTNEECAKAIDMGNFYRVPADNRGLNYDKYFKDGDEKRNTLTEFNSNNTKRLNLEETKEKIASLEYIQAELAKME